MPSRVGRPAGVDSADTRARVLLAARRLFAARGFAATTTKEIASQAGLTPAAVHHHYQGKAAMFEAVYEAAQTTIEREVADRLDGAVTLPEKTTALLEAFLRVLRRDPEIAGFVAVAPLETRRHPELAHLDADRRWAALYAQIAREAADAGEIDPRDQLALRGVLAAVVLGLAQLAPTVSVRRHADHIRTVEQLFAGELIRHPTTAEKPSAR